MRKFFTSKYYQLRDIHRSHYTAPVFNQKHLVAFIILLVITSQLALNLYLPSLPKMVHYFNTDISHIQLSVTLYLLGYGLSQFVYGPLSDVYGRRWIIIWGLFIFIMASVLCISSQLIWVFLCGRFLQGVGIGCGDTMGRAILCERFDSKAFIRAACHISLAATIVPMLGPVLGGYIEKYLGWRFGFVLVFLYALSLLLLIIYYLPETKQPEIKHSLAIKPILKNYYTILTNRVFLAFFMPGMVCFVGEALYNMMSSFLMQDQLGWGPATFGWLNATVSIGLILGSLLTSRMAKVFSHVQMVFYGICILLLSSIAMLLPSLFHILNTACLLIPMTFFMVGVAMIYPNTNMGALSPFTTIAGTAGALQGGLQMICGGVIGIFLGDIVTSTQFLLAISLTILISSCFAFFVLLLSSRTRREAIICQKAES